MTESQLHFLARSSVDIKQRAISENQKNERRQHVMDVAWSLFQDTPLTDVSMSAIAEQAGLAKGTLYLYFNTKEELFLALLHQKLETWFDEIDAALNSQRSAGSPTGLAKIFAQSLNAKPRLLRLLGKMNPVLEPNSSFEVVQTLKHMLIGRLNKTGQLLEASLPTLKPGDGIDTLLRIYALIIGVQHLSMPSAVARSVIARDNLTVFQIDFDRELSAGLELLFLGLAARP
jgi:AcrR family transcriptional regulator